MQLSKLFPTGQTPRCRIDFEREKRKLMSLTEEGDHHRKETVDINLRPKKNQPAQTVCSISTRDVRTSLRKAFPQPQGRSHGLHTTRIAMEAGRSLCASSPQEITLSAPTRL